MIKVFSALLGIFLCSLGFSFIILYLNLLTMGYSFFNYVKFISSRLECLTLIGGVIILFIVFRKVRIK